MRTPRSIALLSLLTPALLALPVMTPSAPAPRPVPPVVEQIALNGVDPQVAAADIPPPGAVRPGAVTAQSAGARTVALTAAQATGRFSTIGVTWQPDPATGTVQVWVRTRSHGVWSAWSSLGGKDDVAPDAGTPDAAGRRDGTAPYWVGAADGAQVRVDLLSGPAPRDLRLQLIDPGTSAADATAAQDGVPASSASAAAGFPGARPRAAWGADESLRTCSPSYAGTVKAAAVHHTDNANDYTAAQVPSILRGIYAYHVQSNGWCDIGYNFLVDAFGTVWEGRYGGMDRPVIGAHSMGFNAGTTGISMIGNFSTGTPPAPMTAAVARVAAWKLGLSQRDPQGTTQLVSGGNPSYPAGTVRTVGVIFGHRDVYPTACPGDAGYATLPAIRAAARSAIGAGFVDPWASAGSAPVTVRAGLLTPTSWQLAVTQLDTGVVVRRLAGSGSGSLSTVWDRKGEGGTGLPDGAYKLSLSGNGGGSTATPWSATVQVTGTGVPAQSWGPVATSAASPTTTDLVARRRTGDVAYRALTGSGLGTPTLLGGYLLGGPAAVRRAGALTVLGRGSDNALWITTRSPGGMPTWSGWSPLGGTLSSRPAAAAGPWSLNVVAVDGTGAVQQKVSPTPGRWSNWDVLGGAALPGTAPAAAWTPTGRFEVFAVGTDGQLWHRSWTTSAGWTGWQALGGKTSDDVFAVSSSGDQVVVAVRGTDGSAWFRTVGVAGTGGWTTAGGVLLTAPSLAAVPSTAAGTGRTDAIGVGADGALWVTSAPAATSSNLAAGSTAAGWGSWRRLG